MKIKRLYLALALAVAFASGAATMAQVHDWHDLDAVHRHVIDAIHDMERAQQANIWDMGGHASKAVQYLRQAEHELDLSVRWAQSH